MKGIWTAIEYKKEVKDRRLSEGHPRKYHPVIYLWVRTEDLKRKRCKISNFKPYFFVPKNFHLVFDIIAKKELVSFDNVGVLWKVWTYTPDQVRQLRQILYNYYGEDRTFEADVPFVLRFLIDSKIRSSVEITPKGLQPIDEDLQIPLRIVYLDIEVLSDKPVHEGKLRKNDKIICISAFDSYERVYYTWYVRKNPVPIKSQKDWVLIRCSTVGEMLRRFVNYIVDRDPDVLTGYNIDFDLLCMRYEAKRRGVLKEFDKLSSLSDKGYGVGRPRTKKYRIRGVDLSKKTIKIPGRNIIDLLDLIRMISRKQLESYSLEYISKVFLKSGKTKLTWKGKPVSTNIVYLWKTNPSLVLEYNKRDVELCVDLDKENELISFLDELRKVVGVRLEDAFSTQRMIDVECLRRSKDPLPSKHEKVKDFRGAYVFPPKKGMHEWVVQLDYASLYPSIIRTFNIDQFSWLPIESEDCYKFTDPETGEVFRFRKEPRGLFPTILDDFIKLRMKYKELMKKEPEKAKVYDVKQNVYKTLANAVYGGLAYRSRQASRECAQAVTVMGKIMLHFAEEVAKSLGYEALYGDTDSIFIATNASSFEEAKKIGTMVEEEINRGLPEKLKEFGYEGEQIIRIKLEKIYRRIFFITKKRYFGYIVHEDGSLTKETKGLEIKRSDASAFAKQLQEKVLDMMMSGKSAEEIKKEVEQELNKYDTLPKEVIGVPSAVSKPLKAYAVNSIQKKAAELANRYLGTNYDYGSKPLRAYVYTENKPPTVLEEIDVIAFDNTITLPEWIKIDYPKMLEKTVRPKIEKLLESLGITWDSLNLKEELKIKRKRRRKKKSVTLDIFLGEKDAQKIS